MTITAEDVIAAIQRHLTLEAGKGSYSRMTEYERTSLKELMERIRYWARQARETA